MPKLLADAHNVNDVKRLARHVLPKGIYEFIARGTEDEVAMDNNRLAFQRIKLHPRVCVNASAISLETELFGEKIAMPLAISPTGSAGIVWFRGEVELAKAAARANVPFTLATRSMSSIETIAEEAGGNLWLQVYVWQNQEMSYQLVDRAKRAGFRALVVTVDTPLPPNREYNQRNRYSLPFRASGTTLLDMSLHPRWLLNVMGRYMLHGGIPRYETLPGRPRITQPTDAAMSMSTSVDWGDIRELRRRWPGVLIVKGILRASDALMAASCGADAVIVSNHGGRNMDSSPASIEVLPEIVETAGTKLKVLLDSGIWRGSDIVKAVSSGATAVLSGRPALFGTAVAGQAGAAQVLDILRKEMHTTMGMIGRESIDQLGHDALYMPPSPAARHHGDIQT